MCYKEVCLFVCVSFNLKHSPRWARLATYNTVTEKLSRRHGAVDPWWHPLMLGRQAGLRLVALMVRRPSSKL